MTPSYDIFISAIIQKVSEDYSLSLKKKYLVLIGGGGGDANNNKKKKKKTKRVKKIAPVHNHPLCKTRVPDCPLCQSHGNIMNFEEEEIEYELV